jgi:YHS domain-containing protein
MDVNSMGKTVFVVAAALLAAVIVYGCQKSEPVKVEQQAAAAAVSDMNGVIEQKTCPVMGNPIDKNVFIVYKGKKVYFCCPMCKPEFEKNPEKYIGKLPQFAK